jgi:archaellum component FlaC
MTGDSFEKAKKGMKDTAKGVEDTAKGVEDTAGGVEETAEGVIEGVEDTAERVIEGVKDTVEGVKEGVEETAEGVKDTAEEVVDTDTYTGSDDERENREYNESGSKEPMNPEDIASHGPTAVKRDKKQGTSGDPV